MKVKKIKSVHLSNTYLRKGGSRVILWITIYAKPHEYNSFRPIEDLFGGLGGWINKYNNSEEFS